MSENKVSGTGEGEPKGASSANSPDPELSPASARGEAPASSGEEKSGIPRRYLIGFIMGLVLLVAYLLISQKDKVTPPAAPAGAQPTAAPAAQPAAKTPSESAQLVNESLSLYQQGKFYEALAAARKATELDPQDANAFNNMCAAYNSLEMWDKAIDSCQKALAINPSFELAKNNLSWALKKKEGK